MYKIFTNLILFSSLFLNSSLSAQDYQLISIGEEYALQSYFQFSDCSEVQIENSSWDLAFSYFGQGILINESSQTTFLEPAKEIRCYLAPTNDFSVPFTSDDVSGRLWNDESDWNEGAFNSVKDPNNSKDLGWGLITNSGIEGSNIFVLRLRNGRWKKILVESKSLFEYQLRIADLDGSNEILANIPIPDFSPEFFGYYSVEKNKMITNIPARWDLVFKRYVTPLDDGEGGILDYTVTGALSFPGTYIAPAIGVDPFEANLDDYSDAMSPQSDLIGYDWKSFDFDNTNEWTVYDDQAYFIQTAVGQIWKIIFIDFEGNPTGNIVFQKFLVGYVLSADEKVNNDNFMIFPNPASEEVNIKIDQLPEAGNLTVSIYNHLGQQVWNGSAFGRKGFNVLSLPIHSLSKGQYILRVSGKQFISSQPLVIEN